MQPPPSPKPGPSSTPHPFADTASQLVLLPNSIDVEEESRLYDELCADNDNRSTSNRPRSSPVPPSVFSRDSVSIFLGDNTGESLAFARDVSIGGWTNVGDKMGGAYVVYDCAIKTREGTVFHALKRYNDFARLNSALRQTLPQHLRHFVPLLPPKSPLSRYRPSFLDHRRLALQYWLSAVLLHPEIGGCKAVRQWITE